MASVELSVKLFDGEEIILGKLPSDNDDVSQSINDKYEKGISRIVTEQARYPLGSIVGMIESQKYKLNPDFQRRRRWDPQRKSRLIESFIINVPVPPVFLYEANYAFYEVMDGQQRINAIYEFYKGQFKLRGLEQWQELNGYTYDKLPEQIKAGIDRRFLSSIILLKETTKDEKEGEKLKKLVFERINSGGVQLTPQETRNAIYDGKLNNLCKELAENNTFRNLINIHFDESGNLTEDSDRNAYAEMDDVELVLRFFAYRHLKKFKGSLESALDSFLDQGNGFSQTILDQYKQLFNKTIDLSFNLFGNQAFWLYGSGRKGTKKETQYLWKEKSLRVVYDAVMQSLSQFIDQKDILMTKKTEIVKDIKGFYRNNEELFSGRKATFKDAEKRINAMYKFFLSYVN
jgi:Protein of unknown function DUF262